MSAEPAPHGARIEVEREGRVETWRIDYPPHNFMNGVMVAELDSLVRAVERNPSVGAVVIAGARPGLFVTHYDVAEIVARIEGIGLEVSPRAADASLRTLGGLARFPQARSALKRTPASGFIQLHEIHELFSRLGRLDKVVIAAIGGPAGGGGCELALASDLRYMSDDAERIGLPEMTLGFPPGAGGTQRLARLIGPGRALEMILEARPLPPEQALDIGLIHRVVPSGRLLDAALETAERMARRAPGSVAALKRSIYEGAATPLPAGLARERKLFLSAASRPAAVRALRAYLEDLERTGVPGWGDEQALAAWREGTRVDLVGGD
jgi:enoyl-CoA hydratase